MLFPSLHLNTSNTYNVLTLFAAVRILLTLYSDWKFDGLYVTKIVFVREAVMFNECKVSASEVSECFYNHEWKPDWQVNCTKQSGDFETHSIVNTLS